jgi:hypothetical protein
MLPSVDTEFLNARMPGFSVTSDGGALCVLLPNFPLPPGYDRGVCDLLLRLSPGYPDVPPDMWWFSPAVRRVDGAAIAATQVQQVFFGRQWQRWSRHLTAGQWRSGIDSLESYLALVRKELHAAAPPRAA